MDDYEPTQAGRSIADFVDDQLSNWYVRLCRRRFWKGTYEHDKICAYQTLYECLEVIARLMAPISPFFADWMFRNLNDVARRLDAGSVHLADYPVFDTDAIDEDLEERMTLAQDISSLILSLRKKVNIKVRQPLYKVLIPVLDARMRSQIAQVEDLIRNEVNVKLFEYIDENNDIIRKKVKPNFKSLGQRMGNRMKTVAAAITAMGQSEISALEQAGMFELRVEGEPVSITSADVDIVAEDVPGWSVAHKDNLTVALDIEISPELRDEGNARELVNRIQKIRKETGFELTDRIALSIEAHEPLKTAIINFNDYICTEILADNIQFVPEIQSGIEVEVNEGVYKVLIHKNQSHGH